MSSTRQRSLLGVLPALPVALVAAFPAAALEPYQTVRSMQLVQDRIADGDHAAMPMQTRVLALADQSMREADPALFEDPRNFEALLIYGMSGGNPVTLDVVTARLKLTDQQKLALGAISQYLRGNMGGAAASLRSLETDKMPLGSRTFLSLIKGSLLAKEQPNQALQLFNFVRLEAPGTLIEEAALRRSLPAAVALKDAPIFLHLASQYARRFLRSPYATQFADELVNGIVTLYGTIDLGQVEQVVSEMTPAHRKVVYLRLARTSAIEGLRELSDFAARKAAEYGGEPGVASNARAQLYANLTSVASENAEGVLETLRKIDREELNTADRQLLDAAMSVASVVIKPTANHDDATATKAPSARDAAASEQPASPEPPAIAPEPAQHEPVTDKSTAVAPVDTEHALRPPDPESGGDNEPLTVVIEAKQKLGEIDKLLADDK
jgi:chemotaxis protein MotC